MLFGTEGKRTQQLDDYQYLKLFITIDIAPNSIPKKSRIYITPFLGENAFRTFGFEDEKARGGTQPIFSELPAHVVFRDSVLYEYSALGENVSRRLDFHVLNKKGKSKKSSVNFNFDQALTFYFTDQKQKKFTVTVSYKIE